MTVYSPINRIVYSGDGVTLAWPFPYYFFADSNLVVIKKLIASPYTETTLVLNTDYSVTGAGNMGPPPGGTVTTVAVVAATHNLIIERIMPLKQETDLEEYGDMPAESIEASFDKIVMICQQLQAEIDTSILINLPTLVTGYLYNDGTALSWSTITTTAYPGNIGRGLDAAKAAVPSAGDIYIAIDTYITYICYVAGTWVAHPNFSGLTAKGASLANNDLFMIEDSAAAYVKKKVLRSELKTDITDNCALKTGVQTINGLKTFGSTPLVPAAAPTLDAEVANKKYVDDVLNSAAGNDAKTGIDTQAEATIAQVAINTIAGHKVILMGMWYPTQNQAANPATAPTIIRLYRDATLLITVNNIDSVDTEVHTAPVLYIDLGAGTAATTYKITARSNRASQLSSGWLSVCQVK